MSHETDAEDQVLPNVVTLSSHAENYLAELPEADRTAVNTALAAMRQSPDTGDDPALPGSNKLVRAVREDLRLVYRDVGTPLQDQRRRFDVSAIVTRTTGVLWDLTNRASFN